ncbi:ABC transporter permease [Clostridium sp. MD294]|uniref:ABC transporter permease n=1 Tax=Clostridium sp. MD294 TaxID=97138 RepID=UPI0002CC1759|nr:ABC transporter permease [Clostridium sp. MD294]USF29261.1 Macrolide export ATP-binding/permease protein MacB [Clostridium sp. MD294]
MSVSDMVKMALRNLWKRKLRTFLTILGVIIGTASIVVMVSIGIGMNESFQKQVEEWGSLQVINVYTAGNNSYYYDDSESTSSKNDKKATEITVNTIEEFKKIPHVEAATPVMNEYLYFVAGKYVADASVQGIDPASMEAMGYKAEQGRVLQEGDSKTLVFGGDVVSNFYNPKLSWRMRYDSPSPEIDILNDKVMITTDWNYGTKHADKAIKPIKVDVVGTVSSGGSDGYNVFMPIKELEKIKIAQSEYEAKKYNNRNAEKIKKGVYQSAMVKVDNMDNVKEVQESIKNMGFRASSLTDELETMKETTKMLRMMLGAIGAISLIVAAIGITNTMVMAIYERTREIGVMKVIGASLADIKKLFLTEAAFIGFAGGLAGILVSLGASKIVNIFAIRTNSNMLSSIPIWLCGASLVFATFIGIAAGYLPAKRAMKLSALSAIKTE